MYIVYGILDMVYESRTILANSRREAFKKAYSEHNFNSVWGVNEI